MPKKILLIGGTETERALLKSALDDAGNDVSAAVTRRFTTRWLARRIKPFDLIIYDLADADQPDDFWPEFREAAGAAAVIVITGAGDARDYLKLGFDRVLRRPCTVGDVVQAAGA